MRFSPKWLVLSLALGSSVIAAPQSWELRDGRWQPLSAPTTKPMPVSDETLDRVEEMVAQRRGRDAYKLALEWVRMHKDSPIRDRGLYLLAEASYWRNDLIKSFYYFDEMMDEYPDSAYFARALSRQHDIADAFLNGHKRSFLFMFRIGAEDEAVDMLYRVQSRSPGSPLAEKALLRTADFYYADAQYDLAADAYGAYVRSYPRSPKIPRVRLRQAFANYAQFRGLRFDPSTLLDARAQLVDLIAAYPDLADEENLRPIIDRIDRTFAQKIYETADFYRRTGELRGAAYNYRFLIATYPNMPEAEMAQKRLSRLPAKALEIPTPQAGHGYAPATQPVTEER